MCVYTLTQPQDDNHDLFPGSSSPPRAYGLDGPGCAGILVPSGAEMLHAAGIFTYKTGSFMG